MLPETARDEMKQADQLFCQRKDKAGSRFPFGETSRRMGIEPGIVNERSANFYPRQVRYSVRPSPPPRKKEITMIPES